MSTQYKDYYGTHMPFGQFPKFGVLSSVKVLMTGTNIAGPFAASIMAEMGAQVIQVEAPNMPCQTRGNYGYSQDHRNTYSITRIRPPRYLCEKRSERRAYVEDQPQARHRPRLRLRADGSRQE